MSGFDLKLGKEVQKLLNENGTIVHDKNGYKHYFLPYWFSSTDSPDQFEVNNLDHLPPDLVAAIKIMRGE